MRRNSLPSLRPTQVVIVDRGEHNEPRQRPARLMSAFMSVTPTVPLRHTGRGWPARDTIRRPIFFRAGSDYHVGVLTSSSPFPVLA